MKAPLFLLAALLAASAPASRAQSPASSDQPLRVGIAGLAHGHVDGFFQHYLHDPRIVLVGIAEPDRQVAENYARRWGIDRGLLYSSLDTMLDQTHPSAVLIYTSTYDHRRAVEACARHRIDAIMEKPLATTVEDARAIARAARRSGIQVIVNYETTWYSSNRAAYDILRDGSIGGLRKLVIHDGHQGPIEIGVTPPFLTWLVDPKLNGGGALFDFGCYGADLATWMVGNRLPLTVTAVTQQIKPDLYPRVDDEATVILTYPKAQVILQASWNWPFGRKDMEVYGRTGTVFTVGPSQILVRKPGEAAPTAVTPSPLPPPYDDEISYLRAVVLDGLKPQGLGALDTNVIVTEILDAARRSAAEGRTIRLSAGD